MNNSKQIQIPIILLFIIFFCTDLQGQRLISRKYTIDNGLSSNRVYSIIQDSIGFIWLGTHDGLNRFDGINFKKYYYSDAEGSISSNSIRRLLIDNNNKMWIAHDSGIDIYDPQTDRFTHFDATTKEGEKVTTRVLDLIQDKEGMVWIATNGSGLYRYNTHSNELASFKNDSDNPYSIPQNFVVALLEDSRGNIWLGTYSQGIACYSKESDRFTTFKKEDGPNSISDNSIQCFFEDSYGNLWIGTFQNGLDLYDYSSRTFTNFHDRGKGNFLYHIQDIIEHNPGELLIASDNGIAVFNISEGRILAKDESGLRIAKNSNKFVYSLFKDKEESLWLGTYYDGTEFYSSYQNNFDYYSCTPNELSKAGKVINALCEDTNGNFWIGTDDNGIFYFDPRNKRITPFHTGADIRSTYYCVHDLLLDNGNLYAATYERGLEVFDLKSGKITSYRYNAADTTTISSSRVFVLYKASNGRIYVGTSVGLCLFNRETGQFQRVANIGKVSAITEDSQGKVWVATSDNGLFAYDLKKQHMSSYTADEGNPHSLVRNTLTVLAIDRKKRLWIGTQGYGLCRYDEVNDCFIRNSHPEFPNQIISSIIPEGDGLWISTNKGLVFYNPDTDETKTYTKSNGLYNEQFTPGAGLKSADGRILMGTADGFCYYSAQKIMENEYDAPVVLTSMSILGQEVHAKSPDSPIDFSIEYTKDITLSHNQSFVGFGFAALSFISPEENHYQYKLEGLDADWRNVKGNQNSIQYTHLPAGNYTLRVRGSNSDSMWSSNEISLNLKILPPFFKSNTAYAIYIVLIIACIIGIIVYLINLSDRKQQRRIREINKQKEKELYDSKIEFFTQIAHEIRTPLSLIVGPLEYLRNSASIERDYGDYLKIIEQNYKRLSTLVNQLLDFRKVDAGLYKLSYNTYLLRPLLEKVISLFELTAKEKNIRLNLLITPGDLSIITDEEAFTKIISNLLANAIKYAREEISIQVLQTNNKGFILEITDDGPGIPDSEKEKIFDAFYQVKNNKEINKLGIGIGLNMTRSIISLMDGHITAGNRTDGKSGLTISVLLPQQEINVSAQIAEKKLESVFVLDNKNSDLKDTIPGEEHTANKLNSVLVVDDNQDILNFLAKVLSRDYFVISATSGEDAISLLENNQVDIIVSDVMMYEMDGFELCRYVKSSINTSHIPVVLLTAKTDTASKIQGLESGADAYIEKPFSPLHLNAQIHNLLEKREDMKRKYASNPFAEIHTAVHNKLDEEFMNKCTQIIESNINEPDFSVTTMATELGMSRTSVFVKVKGITGMTPNDFIKLTRLKMACKMMSETDYRITEIGFLVGFSSSSYFAKCFQKQFGMLPTEFMKSIK